MARQSERILKVLAFGTFDLLHPGHEYNLRKASKYGQLHVIVARDSVVEQLKKRKPIHNEKQRMASLESLDYVHKVYLGSKTDRYALIEKIRPDIIVLGYDQTHFTKNLKNVLKERGLDVRIVRFRKPHFPEKYKSSIIRRKIKRM